MNDTLTAKNVVAYVRVSTDGQAGEDKFGIDSQKEIIMAYCQRNNMQISEWYIDKGQSGVKESRPKLDELLYGEVRNPPVEAVVVAKSDRVARDIKLYYYFLMLFQKKDMNLISATEEVVNDDTGLGNVYKALMLFVAEQERMNITKRTSGGRLVKAAKGGYSGGRTPYGYAAENKKMVIVPEQAKIVRLMFKLKDEDKKTLQQICDILNSLGYTNKSGNKWFVSSVKCIIDNKKVYQGFYKYGNGEWVEGEHEPILPR